MATGLFNLKQVNQAISQGAWSGYIAPRWVEYLVVAGGGGGGYNIAAGGGAGGLLTGIVSVTTGTSYTVTVGTGGAGATSSVGTNGVSSVFGSISALGGGGGGGPYNNATSAGVSGGSGGGAAYSALAGGQGTVNQGNAGGNGVTAPTDYQGAGGGGAGTVGLSAAGNAAGNGGAGIASSISGTVTTYAGGGGSATHNGAGSTAGIGGVGGGGTGGKSNGASRTSGTANTGGGGGGGEYITSGGAGGSGIVVVRYPGNVQFFTGGTVNYNNGYIIHIFTASGTLAPTTPTPYNTSYQISRSLRFNTPDSTYLNRTPASNGNLRTYTWSFWIKKPRNTVDYEGIFSAGNGTDQIRWQNDDTLLISLNATTAALLITTQVFRDVSAWGHLVVAFDTTQATSSNRIKVYWNGVQITAFGTSTYPTQNYDCSFNSTSAQVIGRANNSSSYLSGYMTEVNFIDGQQLTPSSFGATSTTTGVWSPIQYTGTYGTNGFYLNFSDNSNTTAATLGKDYSGNGNNWTPNNFSVTAGAGNDSLVDSPTSYGTDTGVGGTVRGNYATNNPLLGSTATLSNGNLDIVVGGSATKMLATIGMSSGKWYWEYSFTDISADGSCGIATSQTTIAAHVGNDAYSWTYISSTGDKRTNSSSTAYGATYTTGDVIGVAFDADAGTLVYYKNGTSQGTAFSSLTSGPYFPAFGDLSSGGSSSLNTNFGQRPFAYTAPSGYKALCTQNLPTPTIGATTATQANKYFDTTLWSGNDGAQTIANSGSFQPDWIWAKCRSTGAIDHGLTDVLRGPTSFLSSSLSQGEQTIPSTWVNPASNGIALNTSNATYNGSGKTYVGWQWKANGSGSSNTSGSITSTVSANTTSGFSVLTYTGTGVAGTIGHGLGVAPSMIIVKSRSATGAWPVYFSTLGNGSNLVLNTTAATATSSTIWNATSPTSSVFSVGINTDSNTVTVTYVAYCFTPIAGYSAFGSYTGNGSTDGPFVFTGFRPAFVMLKCTSAVSSWEIHDTTRALYNVDDKNLYANLADAEATYNVLDELSNGFKLRTTLNGTNQSSGTYIYMAFASNPFKYSLAR